MRARPARSPSWLGLSGLGACFATISRVRSKGLGLRASEKTHRPRRPRRSLPRLAEAATEVEFGPAVTIIEGDAADAIYVLVDGEVEVSARGKPGGAEKRLRTMQAPTYFGEIGVLEQIPRTATVTAITHCRCERVEGSALLDALTAAPPWSTLMENARSRLALTHPLRSIHYEPPELELSSHPGQ